MKKHFTFLRPFFLSIFYLLSSPVNAQPVLMPSDSLEVSCLFFTVDPLGNLYCATRDGMTKYDAGHRQQWHYSNPRYGRIHHIDASDPLNILVYHADFQQIVWLDRNLAEKPQPDPGSLLRNEFPEKVCSSAQGGFWVFMPQSGQLRRYSQALRLEAQSLPFFEILPGLNSPSFMTEAAGKIYVSQPDHGVAVFDAFGNLLSVIPLKGLHRFQVRGNQLLWFTQKELGIFDVLLQKESLFLLPETGIRSGLVTEQRVFIQTETSIKVFQAAGGLF